MSHEDEEAAELEHAEEVGLLIFPARDEAAEVMQPSKQPFDFPTVAVAPQLPAVLSVFPAAIALVRSDQTDAVFFSQPLVERIAVVGREKHRIRLIDRKSTRLNSSHVAISYAVFCLKKKKKVIIY